MLSSMARHRWYLGLAHRFNVVGPGSPINKNMLRVQPDSRLSIVDPGGGFCKQIMSKHKRKRSSQGGGKISLRSVAGFSRIPVADH